MISGDVRDYGKPIIGEYTCLYVDIKEVLAIFEKYEALSENYARIVPK